MKDEKEQAISLTVNVDTTPILFTDSIFMTTNEDGLTLEIGQKVIGTNQLRIVARIGMSRSHAKKVSGELSRLLAITEGQGQTGEKKN